MTLLVTVNSSGLRDNATRDRKLAIRLHNNPTCYRELAFRVRDNATDLDWPIDCLITLMMIINSPISCGTTMFDC